MGPSQPPDDTRDQRLTAGDMALLEYMHGLIFEFASMSHGRFEFVSFLLSMAVEEIADLLEEAGHPPRAQ